MFNVNLFLKTLSNATGIVGLNNSGLVFKTAKACAQLYQLDFIAATSIYIRGNFNEIKEEQKVNKFIRIWVWVTESVKI